MATNIDYIAVRENGQIYIEGEYGAEQYSDDTCTCTQIHYLFYTFTDEQSRELYEKLKAVYEKPEILPGWPDAAARPTYE